MIQLVLAGLCLGAVTPPDRAGKLQVAIDAAITRGGAAQIAVSGEYFFGNRTLLIQGATDLAVLATAPTTFWFAGHQGGVRVRDSFNVTISGRNLTGAGGIRIDRAPKPYTQATITARGGKDRVSFSVDGDSADPRTLTPASDPDAPSLDGPLCTGWKKGSRSADGRPGSRGSTSYLGCLKPADAIQVGGSASRDFYCDKGCLSDAEVGDQFLLFVWKGFTYNIENSTSVTTEDLAIHATGYFGVYEADGGGGHVYRRFTLAPRHGMIVAANADGFHSSNCDRGPTIENSVIRSLLDDFLNVQTTMQLVMAVSAAGSGDGADAGGNPSTGTHTLTVVHPHVSDQPVTGHTDQWYGTTEPFSRVRKGDVLILYDPATFEKLGTVAVADAAVLLSPSSDVTSPIGKQADALYPDCCTHFLSFQPEKYSLQKWRSSVYEVAVDGPLPAAAANLTAAGTVPYVIQIERTAASGTVLRNNVFEDSRGFFGRWKSSHSVIENCTFRGSAQNVLELQMLPSHYEAPITITNVTIVGNTFEVDVKNASFDDVFNTGPDCCKVQGFVQHDNRLVQAKPPPPSV